MIFPYVPPPKETPRNTPKPTWFPILLGVVCGYFVCTVLTYRACDFIEATFPGPFVGERPARCGIYFTLYVYGSVACGGLIGVFFSAWTPAKALLYLVAFLLVFAAFDAFGKHLGGNRIAGEIPRATSIVVCRHKLVS